ncbi:MAG: hypothetical protein K0R12_713 [Gammaproteobacteria bacterium]|jgi:hypothetical protein|nr:hypothetical protein [Gammaproteobacteria bacterium]
MSYWRSLKISSFFFFFVLLLGLSACTATPKPNNVDSICAIFHEYPDWYWAAKKTEDRWGVPIAVQMSIMRQESSFIADAKPPRTKLLWVIPWTRPSDAYGYGQVKDDTWDSYRVKNGGIFPSRANFADVSDFVGWYAESAHRRAGISKSDAYRLYLAYHEGVGGYQRGTYRDKEWLIHVAEHVSARASIWQSQLQHCESKIPKPWYSIL